MNLAYTIIYVPNVLDSVDFFERAFGLSRRFVHEAGDYGELATGTTTLAFASHQLGQTHFPDGYIAAHLSEKPLGFELAFATVDVERAHQQALQNGATEIVPPTQKPWGQTVSYVRCPDGTLVELCTPMGA